MPIIIGLVLLIIVVLYFVLTSAAFIRAMVLPKVAKALGADVTVEDISLSPLSSLELRKVKVTPYGAETLAVIDTVRVRYALFAIIRGNIDVSEITVEGPVITLVQTDKSNNLPKGDPSAPPSASSSSAKTPQLNVRNVAIRNGTLRSTTMGTNGTQVAEISGLNVTLDRIANAATGKLTIGASVSTTLPDRSGLAGKLDGAYDIGLDEKLFPTLLKGTLKADVASATGTLKDLSGFAVTLDADSTTTEIRQFRLAFQQGGQPFGQVLLSGPFDAAKKEARITYKIDGIDRRVLKIAAPALPYDFGRTAISADGRVDLVQQGQVVTSQGKLTVSDFSLATTNGATPLLRLVTDYKGGVNFDDKTAIIEKLDIAGTQAGKPLLAASLDRPMNVAWDKTTKGFRESTFKLSVTGLNTTDWKALAGPDVPSAILTSTLVVRADQDGKDIKVVLDSVLDQINAVIGGNSIKNARLALAAEANVLEFQDIRLGKATLGFSKGTTQILNLGGTANLNLARNESGAQFSGEINLPAALAEIPVEGLALSSGSSKLAVTYTAKDAATNVSVNISLTGLTGAYGEMKLSDYQLALSVTADLLGTSISVQKFGLAAQSGYTGGGSLDGTGQYDYSRGNGEFSFKTVNLNENALAPLLAPSLKPNKLVSVSLDMTGSGKFEKSGAAEIKADLQVSRFVVDDPSGALPKTPLALGLSLDAGQKGSATEVRKFLLDLGKTDKAANQLTIAGKIDMSPSNAAPSTVTIKSDGLDLTTLYGVFAGGASTNSAAATKPAASTPAAAGEPEPVKLPFRQFTADLDIAKIILREVEVSGWKSKVAIKDETVTVDPFALNLNGAPVTAKIAANVGVPGYQYDVQFGADKIQLEPFVNSFMPDRKGQIHGTLVANAAIKGAGITGASLAKNLGGGFDFAATNLNLKLEDARSPLIKTLINVVVAIPNLIKNPAAQVGSFLGKLAGTAPAGSGGSWVDELQASPIEAITVAADLGGGGVNLKTARIQSRAFLADARGGLKFAPVLTNSPLEIPVSVALQRRLAEKSMLLDPATPTNAVYAPLPDFVTMKGTMGAPKPDINYVAVAAMGTRTLGRAGIGLGTNVVDKIGNVGNVIGNILGGGAKSTNAPAASTNAPANPLGDLLKGFGRPKN